MASWHSVSHVVVVSADGERQCEWSLPTDLDLKRAELEELLQ
ncbi:MAG: hypothetical protein WCQ20_15015 [Synechococcaceae cyanobacterium ELA739]